MNCKIKKIMLLFPPVTRPKNFSAEVVRISVFFPLGLAYLAAAIEQTKKYQIKVIDALVEGDINKGTSYNNGKEIRYGLSDKKIIEFIRYFSPDAIGVSCLFAAMQWDAANICKLSKEVNPNIITIIGGAHAGINANYFFKNFNTIDYVIMGEGEDSIITLLENLQSNSDLSRVDGVAYLRDKKIINTPKTRFIENLDIIPYPARHLFNMKKYLSQSFAHSTFRNTPFTQMITSRGCPLKCAFCALGNHWGTRQRFRSVKNILDEIEHLIEEYGIQEIHFEDDNLTANKKRACELFDGMVERNFNITWNVPSGIAVYTLDDEILEKMKASGCYSVSLAIESGNQHVLRNLMNKPLDLKKVPKLVNTIRNFGMDARGFFILGYPDETRETIQETISFAKQIELDWAYFFIASPLPNTKMWEICVKKGYIKEEDFDPYRSFHTSIIRTPEFDPEYLAEVREKAIIDVNFRNNPNLLKYNINKAIDNFKDVVNKYPHFDFANFYLGEAYLKKGNREKALKYYKKCLAITPSHEETTQRLNQLRLI